MDDNNFIAKHIFEKSRGKLMELEKEIQMDGFLNEYQKAGINLIYTTNWLNQKISDIFKPYDITQQQFNILRILRGQNPKPATIKLLKERMLDKM